MSTSLEFPATDAREAVDLACRLYGRQRGWAIAGRLLGIAERTARAISYGETSGTSIDPNVAFNARMKLRRARAEQIRAELRALEIDHVETPMPGAGPNLGLGR